jgi:Topoisomerase DNA binding C4 zinc finger
MANPQIDQFMQALIWKAFPWIFAASVAGLLLREGLQWLERRAVHFGRERRQRRAESEKGSRRSQTAATGLAAPQCPICNTLMVKRTAQRGPRAGSSFWGCPKYPDCRGTEGI